MRAEPKEWELWKNSEFTITSPSNPHIPQQEGIHLKIYPNRRIEKGWSDPEICGRAFTLAAKAAKIIIEKLKIVDWANLQYNGNWGLLPENKAKGEKLEFHVHVYGRKKTSPNWAKPVPLPKLPDTYKNNPLSEDERKLLIDSFKKYL